MRKRRGTHFIRSWHIMLRGVFGSVVVDLNKTKKKIVGDEWEDLSQHVNKAVKQNLFGCYETFYLCNIIKLKSGCCNSLWITKVKRCGEKS